MWSIQLGSRILTVIDFVIELIFASQKYLWTENTGDKLSKETIRNTYSFKIISYGNPEYTSISPCLTNTSRGKHPDLV